MPHTPFSASVGYRWLDVWVLASVIQLGTQRFCTSHLGRLEDPCGRLFDQMAMAARLDVPLRDLDERHLDFTPDFRNPAMPSIVSQTDAMVKIASVVPGFAGTDVFFEQVGFPEDMRRKAENEIKRNTISFDLASVMNNAQNRQANAQQEPQPVENGNAPTVEDTAATPVEEARTLNGAQTQSLLTVIEQYKAGELSLGQAVNVISLSCGISKEDAEAILRGE